MNNGCWMKIKSRKFLTMTSRLRRYMKISHLLSSFGTILQDKRTTIGQTHFERPEVVNFLLREEVQIHK